MKIEVRLHIEDQTPLKSNSDLSMPEIRHEMRYFSHESTNVRGKEAEDGSKSESESKQMP